MAVMVKRNARARRRPKRAAKHDGAPDGGLADNRRGEFHQRLARLTVLWIGEERVNARRDEMVAVEGVRIGPVGERIAEAVQRKLRRLGPDQTIDGIAVVAGDGGSRWLQAGDGDPVGLALYSGDRIEPVGVGRILRGKGAPRRDPLALIAPAPLQGLGGKRDERREA